MYLNHKFYKVVQILKQPKLKKKKKLKVQLHFPV